MHLADPGVVYINGKYYIYIETEVMGVSAGDNVILLATSTNDTDLTFYPNNENPQPVMQPDANFLVSHFSSRRKHRSILTDVQTFILLNNFSYLT